jgi:hypothetical protein
VTKQVDLLARVEWAITVKRRPSFDEKWENV